MQRTGRANAIIWKSVVSAAAMLGVAACACKAPPPAQPVVAAAPEPTPVEPAPPAEPAPPVEPAPPAPPAPPVVAEAPPAPPAPARVDVTIESAPAGAEVHVDDQLVGRTPLRLQLMPDVEVNIRVSHPGYIEKTITAIPQLDKQLIVQVTMAKAKKAAKRPRGTGGYGTLGTGSGTGSGKGEGRGFILS